MCDEFYIEMKTMTKWKKAGDTFEPIDDWNIKREANDVLGKGVFQGPYKTKGETK